MGSGIHAFQLADLRPRLEHGAIALGVLLAPNGGPLPIDDRGRAFGLPAGFLVIEALGGAVLALLDARLVAPLLRMVGPAVHAAGLHGTGTR